MRHSPHDGQPADTSRTEAFSDGVLAIAITLLVLDLVVPAHRDGALGHALAKLWPAYVGFLASFIYVAVIWLNHHAAFRRIAVVDRALNWANLGLLLGAVLLPFPTAVVSEAFQGGDNNDERVAVALYAGVGVVICLSWLAFHHVLSRRAHLSTAHVGSDAWRAERRRSIIGVAGYGTAGLAGVVTTPIVSLIGYLALSVFYAATSEGAPR